MALPPPLWSDAFLAKDIRENPAYQALAAGDDGFDRFIAAARAALSSMQGIEADEQLTIERVITPILTALGWSTPLPKRRLTARDEIDLALYADDQAREQALTLSPNEQALQAAGIVEAKQWNTRLDAPGSGARPGETAAQQLQRYLLIAGRDSKEAVRWGILTDGAQWRLYSYRANPRDRTWEIDLQPLLVADTLFARVPDDAALHQLRIAYLLLRRDSWTPADGSGESLLDQLLAEGRRADERIADDLSDAIFQNVYPELVAAFWDAQPDASAEEVGDAVQIFLYRLLFLSYAEDRGHLPIASDDYLPVSLRTTVRDRVAQSRKYAENATSLWRAISILRDLVDDGSPELGVPAYDGGLFRRRGRLVDQIELRDAVLAPIIKPLSHNPDSGQYISYRTLSIQQLGSIYERLLERTPYRDPDTGAADVRISPYARKDSGSYYTPQELVDLIVEQTLQPLVDDQIEAFRADPTPANDPAEAVLRLRVLDPAMGSGHFLLTVIDWLAEQVLDLLATEWEHAPGYQSPLLNHLADARLRIEEIGIGTPPDNGAIVRRMVLKRCVYGVDKNPMAVELAKVAFWLHTFTPPLPLPFISHRLVCGDSLLGINADTAVNYLADWMPAALARGIYGDVASLRDFTDADAQQMDENLDLLIGGVYESENDFDRITLSRPRVRRTFNLAAGLQWLSADMKKAAKAELHAPLAGVFNGHPGRAIAILYNGESRENQTDATDEYRELRDRAWEIAEREHLIHWEIEFPHILFRDPSAERSGFDAVIGNPPWDRIKLQEVEWWASRDEEMAKAPTAAIRKDLIQQRRQAGDPLAAELDEAAARAAQLSAVFRKRGDYPLLGKGDINLYSLFVERALSLVKPDGIVGLLTPSGIYADKTASEFFRSISTTGRLAGIYDFENRRSANPDAGTAKWFPDVDSRFKFCAMIMGGAARSFSEARCGFYLDGRDDLQNDDRVFPLTPDDFARINPNTATAPTLRSRRGAELVRHIYRQHPVLVQHSEDEDLRPYPVRFHTSFHMRNDSDHFVSEQDLDQLKAYRVVGNRWQRGPGEQWAPLYQGRMIHQFDHRAAGVEINPDNQDNPYVNVEVTDAQRADPTFFPRVEHWVSTDETANRLSLQHRWAVGFRDITNATNERTMIATIAPWSAFGNKVPLLLPDPELSAIDASCLVANLNSLALDFVAKRKLQGTNANWYIVEQLSVIAPQDYDRAFGDLTARALVRDHVLRLTYTAHDLEPFARDLGYEGDPFIWDPVERRQLRARLDALYFHLYGLSEDDADYILNQFPVLRKNEEKAHGRYLTRDLALGHYRALSKGSTDAVID